LSVEILQLQNIPIVWNYLRDPTFSCFYTTPECDRQTHTHTQTDGHIHDDHMYCVSISTRGKNRTYCTCPTKYNYYVGNERRLIANRQTKKYLNDNAQTPLNRFVVYMLYNQVCNRHGNKSNRWSLGLSLSATCVASSAVLAIYSSPSSATLLITARRVVRRICF